MRVFEVALPIGREFRRGRHAVAGGGEPRRRLLEGLVPGTQRLGHARRAKGIGDEDGATGAHAGPEGADRLRAVSPDVRPRDPEHRVVVAFPIETLAKVTDRELATVGAAHLLRVAERIAHMSGEEIEPPHPRAKGLGHHHRDAPAAAGGIQDAGIRIERQGAQLGEERLSPRIQHVSGRLETAQQGDHRRLDVHDLGDVAFLPSVHRVTVWGVSCVRFQRGNPAPRRPPRSAGAPLQLAFEPVDASPGGT